MNLYTTIQDLKELKEEMHKIEKQSNEVESYGKRNCDKSISFIIGSNVTGFILGVMLTIATAALRI